MTVSRRSVAAGSFGLLATSALVGNARADDAPAPDMMEGTDEFVLAV